MLAAGYFTNKRLAKSARGGIGFKHRHRIHLALFGQLMASFEYFLKDFVARAVDATTNLDEKIQKEKWLEINVDRVLANRSGALLSTWRACPPAVAELETNLSAALIATRSWVIEAQFLQLSGENSVPLAVFEAVPAQ